ncbi:MULTISPECIES: PRC-barrel domain-containing protein [unclassified Streptomyces]|uniref:PRC-barrel domain-containing protein n=1 Tax=unclassified Streptomyces TaxID=2593676 RepID=UPI0022B68438|nr:MULTISPECIES: PRC-barrel domain-containing protein [unclassified Streptomyces]MCZ7413989.1 PRC-barrel domain-containing protein [Streptomyces sp. WMMC897]MCZ7430985.1 PRC-barrel domain-containing protein [Streptomyces sp. WMMC1477]
MLLSEISGRTVMSAAEATTLGVVDGLVLAPGRGRVAALRLRRTGGSANLLPWSGIRAVGEDAVMAADRDALRRPDGELKPLAEASEDLVGKRLLTDAGTDEGQLADIDFSADSGVVLALRTDSGQYPGTALVGIGSYAAVLRVP